jgi:hypothetical protein
MLLDYLPKKKELILIKIELNVKSFVFGYIKIKMSLKLIWVQKSVLNI